MVIALMPDNTATTSVTRMLAHLPRRARWILTVGVACAAVGHVTAPEQLVAQTEHVQPGSQITRDQFTKQLARTLGQAHQVLGISTRSESGATSVVLWMHDDDNPGMADPHEIVVISHAPMLRSILWYGFDPGPLCDLEPVNAETIVRRPERFADAWRSSLHVRPQFIMTGVSDMAAYLTGSASAGHTLAGIDLIWVDETSDGSTRTSAMAPLREMRAARQRDGSGER